MSVFPEDYELPLVEDLSAVARKLQKAVEK
jgi:hypothetical protein